MDARSAEAEPGEDGAGEGATPHLVLDGFSGPLELLLSLAREQRIDLAHLSVADLVEQLAAALQEAGPSLGEKGNWVVMACWLLLLRSRLLLAGDAPAQQEAEETTDELRSRLLDLQAAQALASWLERRRQLGRDVFARGQPELLGTSVSQQHQVDVIEFLWASMALFADGADDVETTVVYRPPRLDLWTALDARARILQLLGEAPNDAPLHRFLPGFPTQAEIETPAPLPLQRRAAMASTLIAGLELARDGVVALRQSVAFATITLSACTGVMRHQLDEALV